MKRIGLFCALLVFGLAAGAQKVYFIYMQSDNGAPFYVRLGDQVSSSTASGYVILSGLRDSSYLLQVGFPGSTAESRFPVVLKGEDKGFVLKQVGGAWNLFDLQSLSLTKALAAIGPSEEESRQLLAAADPFTRRLVQASDDLTLLGSGPSAATAAVETLPPAPMKAVPTPEVVAVVVPPAADTVPPQSTAAIPAADITAVAVQPAPVDTEEPYHRSLVTRRSESSTTEGFGLVFIDRLGESSDTIRLLIPNPKEVYVPVPVADTVLRKQEVASTPVPVDTVLVAAPPTVSKGGVDTILVAPVVAAVTVPAKDSVTATPAVPVQTVSVSGSRPRAWAVPDISCEAVAEQKDFLRFRKNMAAAEDEGDMVSVARKEFRKRCYSVAELKLLGTLFLTDLGRYNFYESAWGHVSDQHNFPELELGLKDAYLADRLFELSSPKGTK
ncbi:MAG: hypothetical protein EOO12_05200 [Chitinophagaceae bacterium]|nr:MAG: hypothetical protein EOO12_05200 [Chitinophagaceae bacterium]